MPTHHLVLSPEIDEIPRLLDWVERCCAEAGVDGGAVAKLSLALDEAAANVVNHAFSKAPPPHRFEVTLAIDADRITAELVDSGPAFDPLAAAEPDTASALEERDAGGLGIHLIRRMTDSVTYRRVDGENRLRLEKTRQ